MRNSGICLWTAAWPASLYWEHLGPIHRQWHKDGLSIKGLFFKTPSPGLSSHTVHTGAVASAREKWRCYIPMQCCCPLMIFTPFCTQCYAVEHENKNTLPQAYQVSGHQLVSGSPRNLCALFCFLISFVLVTSAHCCLPRISWNMKLVYFVLCYCKNSYVRAWENFVSPKRQKYSTFSSFSTPETAV